MLAIPATSVPCERAGSIAGNIVSARRARLTPKLIENLAFGSMNWSFLSQVDLDQLQENLEVPSDDEEEGKEEDEDHCVPLEDEGEDAED